VDAYSDADDPVPTWTVSGSTDKSAAGFKVTASALGSSLSHTAQLFFGGAIVRLIEEPGFLIRKTLVGFRPS
jgi:hypothetical protein